jgi:hypothetical protein
MTSASIRIDLLQRACECAIEAIKDRRHREHYIRIHGVSHDDRARIDYRGSEAETRCRRIIATCIGARVSGRDTINLSAADAALVVKYLGRVG